MLSGASFTLRKMPAMPLRRRSAPPAAQARGPAFRWQAPAIPRRAGEPPAILGGGRIYSVEECESGRSAHAFTFLGYIHYNDIAFGALR